MSCFNYFLILYLCDVIVSYLTLSNLLLSKHKPLYIYNEMKLMHEKPSQLNYLKVKMIELGSIVFLTKGNLAILNTLKSVLTIFYDLILST